MPQFHNYVFISYSDEDKAIVENLVSILTKNLSLNVWQDRVGELSMESLKTCPKANKGVIGAKLVLCCLSKSYVKSEFCCNQFKIAHGFQKEIILIMLDDIQLEAHFEEKFYKGKILNRIYKNRHKESLWTGHQFEKLLEYISYALDVKQIKETEKNAEKPANNK